MSNTETHHNQNNLQQIHGQPETVFLSIGHRCTSSSILKYLKLKTESYPFDWLVSKPRAIRWCIENNFDQFTDPAQYRHIDTSTQSNLDGRILHVCDEIAKAFVPLLTHSKNEQYVEFACQAHPPESLCKHTVEDGRYVTYSLPIALTHHDMTNPEHRDYYRRCIGRFRQLLRPVLPSASPGVPRFSPISLRSISSRKIRTLYVHPYIGVHEFNRTREELVRELRGFAEYLCPRFDGQWHGLFIIPFFLDKGMECQDIAWELLERSDTYVIWKVDISNHMFKDGGETFGGLFEKELQSFEARVRDEWRDVLPAGSSV
jgi:hypothetical protein